MTWPTYAGQVDGMAAHLGADIVGTTAWENDAHAVCLAQDAGKGVPTPADVP